MRAPAIAILFLVISTFLNTNAYSQNGIYTCDSQGYSKADKSEDEIYSYKQMISIEISDALGGEISINYITEDFITKYLIIPKTKKVYTDKTERTITNSYVAQLKLNNVLMDEKLLVAIVENMDNNKLQLWFYSEKYKSYNQYFNLIKAE